MKKDGDLEDVVSDWGQSRTVRRGGEWILVYKTLAQDSDIFQALKELLANLDIEDVRHIDALQIIGSRKSVKIDHMLVEDLVGDPSTPSEIIERMRSGLDRDFGYQLYDRGPHRRLAVRLPISDIKDFVDDYTARIKDVIINKSGLGPDNVDDILSVYLLSDESYVRLEPDSFFQEIFELEVEGPSPGAAGEIIMGESPQELVELALKKFKGYKIFRDVQLVEASGLSYDFNAFAVLDSDRILLKYLESVSQDDLIFMGMFMEAFRATRGLVLTRRTGDGVRPTEDISILTIKDL